MSGREINPPLEKKKSQPEGAKECNHCRSTDRCRRTKEGTAWQCEPGVGTTLGGGGRGKNISAKKLQGPETDRGRKGREKKTERQRVGPRSMCLLGISEKNGT